MFKQILFGIILIFFISCKSVPNIIGKWETNYRGKTKIISEFKKNGTVEVYSFPIDSTIKLNTSPLLFEYSMYRENKKWQLKFIDSRSAKCVAVRSLQLRTSCAKFLTSYRL